MIRNRSLGLGKLILVLFLVFPACAELPKNYPRDPSVFITNTQTTRLGQRFEERLKKNKGLSGFVPLIEGTDALIARVSTIRAADKALDVQYYIWHDDTSGKILLHELAGAADRGVRVRLLLDDLNQSDFNETLAILDLHQNIEVRLSNPLVNRSLRVLDLVRFDQIQRRMHNKALIADNQVGIVGGRNIGDEYFTASDDMNFSDFDVWCAGPIVADISKQFDLYWNHELSIPVRVLNKDIRVSEERLVHLRKSLQESFEAGKASPFGYSLKESALASKFQGEGLQWYWAKSKAIFDSPKKLDEKDAHQAKPLMEKMGPLIEGAKKELIAVSSYYIPADEGVQQMAANVQRGVRTVVLTNSLASNDVIGAFAGYKDYREPLIKAGVELYELKPKAKMAGVRKNVVASGARTGLHGKLYIKDRKEILIGSMNLDPRSLLYNSEMGVVIESPEMSEKIAADLIRQLPSIAYRLSLDENSGNLVWKTQENGQTVQFNSEPESGFWLKFWAETLNILLPEKLL